MALHETRAVATHLRDGSLWVGHFIDSHGELNFGDDRIDAAHGLALMYAEASAPPPAASSPMPVNDMVALILTAAALLGAAAFLARSGNPHVKTKA